MTPACCCGGPNAGARGPSRFPRYAPRMTPGLPPSLRCCGRSRAISTRPRLKGARSARWSGNGGASKTRYGATCCEPPAPRRKPDAQHLDIDGILAALGETRLVEIIQFDGRLHVLVATSAGVRRHVAGTWETAVRDAEFSRFALRRLARRTRPEPANDTRRGIRSEPAQAVMAMLDKFGIRLQEQLLAAAADDLGDGPVVIVPPAALHPVPWGLLPALTGRAVTVAPSAMAWLDGQRIEPPADRTVTVVAGPGLEGAQAEAAALADRYANAEVLSAGMATAEKVLASLEGRWLAHIAAHGNVPCG